jgi:hypothetical protein
VFFSELTLKAEEESFENINLITRFDAGGVLGFLLPRFCKQDLPLIPRAIGMTVYHSRQPVCFIELIPALVVAAAVRVRSQRRVLAGLTSGSVDDCASPHAHAIGVELWN